MHNMTTHPIHEAAPPSKVLMSSAPGNQTVQVIEHSDGVLTISLDGVTPAHYKWQPHQVEACIRTYMRLLRR